MEMDRFLKHCVFLSFCLIAGLAETKAACSTKMMIVNEGSAPIIGILAKNSGKTDWLPVGQSQGVTLAPNDKQVIDPGDGTDAVLYDFVFLFGNGQVVSQERIDVCKTTDFRVKPGSTVPVPVLPVMFPPGISPPVTSPPVLVMPEPVAPRPAPKKQLSSRVSTVKVAQASLRTGPGLGYPSVAGGGLMYGTDVLVLKIRVPWIQIAVPEGLGSGRIGYVNGYELTPPR